MRPQPPSMRVAKARTRRTEMCADELKCPKHGVKHRYGDEVVRLVEGIKAIIKSHCGEETDATYSPDAESLCDELQELISPYEEKLPELALAAGRVRVAQS